MSHQFRQISRANSLINQPGKESRVHSWMLVLLLPCGLLVQGGQWSSPSGTCRLRVCVYECVYVCHTINFGVWRHRWHECVKKVTSKIRELGTASAQFSAQGSIALNCKGNGTGGPTRSSTSLKQQSMSHEYLFNPKNLPGICHPQLHTKTSTNMPADVPASNYQSKVR
jgi:hypothetical protein